jgi:hypothetical protein
MLRRRRHARVPPPEKVVLMGRGEDSRGPLSSTSDTRRGEVVGGGEAACSPLSSLLLPVKHSEKSTRDMVRPSTRTSTREPAHPCFSHRRRPSSTSNRFSSSFSSSSAPVHTRGEQHQASSTGTRAGAFTRSLQASRGFLCRVGWSGGRQQEEDGRL